MTPNSQRLRPVYRKLDTRKREVRIRNKISARELAGNQKKNRPEKQK